MSSVNIFNTGKSGLFASRAALSTTGHNIANANTEGYSRQRVEQTHAPPSQIGNTVYGTGTKLKDIHRINDEYLTQQIANEMKLMGQYEEKDLALAQAETVFNEVDNAGLNRLISNFFNEFRKLGNEPESQALRETVRESSNQLAGDFHRISRSLKDVQHTIDSRIESGVREANELVQRIASLNEQIKRDELHGGQAADLRDSRDTAIKKLSNIADIAVATNEKGELTVSVAGIGPLVSGSLFNRVYVQKEKANAENGSPEGALQIYVENLAAPNITGRLKNGRLGGLVESRDQLVGGALRKIDELAYTFAVKVNEIHRQGYTMDGAVAIDFFQQPDTIRDAAEKMSLSNAIRADSNNIATALIPDAPGDNRLVQVIARLQHSRIMNDGKSTMDDFYNATVADLATVTQKNKQVLEHEGHILTQMQKIRDSISGVSLDEETTNLVQYQHAFDAAAKVIKVADELLDTVLNLRR